MAAPKYTPKRLTKPEFTEVVTIATRYPEPYRTTCGKLIRHADWARREIEQLEGTIHEMKQQSFYKKAEELKAPPPPSAQDKPTPKKYPLIERLLLMQKENLIGSKVWHSTLRWNEIREADALKMLADFEVNNSTDPSFK